MRNTGPPGISTTSGDLGPCPGLALLPGVFLARGGSVFPPLWTSRAACRPSWLGGGPRSAPPRAGLAAFHRVPLSCDGVSGVQPPPPTGTGDGEAGGVAGGSQRLQDLCLLTRPGLGACVGPRGTCPAAARAPGWGVGGGGLLRPRRAGCRSGLTPECPLPCTRPRPALGFVGATGHAAGPPLPHTHLPLPGTAGGAPSCVLNSGAQTWSSWRS